MLPICAQAISPRPSFLSFSQNWIFPPYTVCCLVALVFVRVWSWLLFALFWVESCCSRFTPMRVEFIATGFVARGCFSSKFEAEIAAPAETLPGYENLISIKGIGGSRQLNSWPPSATSRIFPSPVILPPTSALHRVSANPTICSSSAASRSVAINPSEPGW